MKSWPSKALLLAGHVPARRHPAFSQDRDDPESLLPPGFGDPKSLPPPEDKAGPGAARPAAPPPTERSPALQESADPDEEDELDEFERPRPTNYFRFPRARRGRSTRSDCSCRAIMGWGRRRSAAPMAAS